MLIYTPQITKRVQYVAQLIFETVSKTEVNLTSDIAAFELFKGPKSIIPIKELTMNYGLNPLVCSKKRVLVLKR